MIRKFVTPLAFKQSLEERLRSRAQATGVVMHRLRQVLIYERFLERVFRVFEDRCVLKGGFVLELRTSRARATKDVDLSLKSAPSGLLEQLREVGRLELGDYLSFDVSPDEKLPEILADGLPYRGLRFRVQAKLAGKIYGSRYGLDVVLAEPAFGVPELVEGSSALAFAGVDPPKFRVYNLESHIAEKLHAYTMPRSRPNSRVKDLPDIALLSGVRVIDSSQLFNAFEWAFRHRGTHTIPSELPPPPDAWRAVYERMADLNDLPWKDIETVYSAAADFLNPVLAGQVARWIPEDAAWQPD